MYIEPSQMKINGDNSLDIYLYHDTSWILWDWFQQSFISRAYWCSKGPVNYNLTS